MKTEPIEPARLELDAQGLPFSSAFGDVYHPRAGAFAQADHVFLAGNGLPGRWDAWLNEAEAATPRQQPPRPRRFVVLETGFGLGNNFLATWACWQAWRRGLSEAQRCLIELEFISIELHPFTQADMALAHAHSPCPELARELIARWPPLTPNLHTLHFPAEGLTLRLALGSARLWLRELVAEVDAFFLDGFAPARNPQMWEPAVFKALTRLAAPGATLATWSAARAVREGLTSAGFEVHKAPGSGGKRDITLARHAPRHARRGGVSQRLSPNEAAGAPHWALSPAGGQAGDAQPDVLIVGAGLAGCSAAWALAEHGLRVWVLDERPQPAQGASGNPAGLFHSVVHGEDAPHARLHRAAALQAQVLAQRAIGDWQVPGEVAGLIRLCPGESLPALEALQARSGLPPTHARAASARALSELAGWELSSPGWLFPGGGWLDPAALCRAFLAHAQVPVRFVGHCRVARLRRQAGMWQLLGSSGECMAQAPQVVLANAGHAEALLRAHTRAAPWGEAELLPTRGQISWLEPGDAARMGLQSGPGLPLAGQGYVIAADAGAESRRRRLVFGASSEPGQACPTLSDQDQQANWDKLRAIAATDQPAWPHQAPGCVLSRAGVRWSAADRLPWVGPAPDMPSIGQTGESGRGGWEQVRRLPRLPGLYLHAALGSRGLTWCSLSSQLLAARMTGTAWPLEASLADALDPARSISRRIRRGDSARGSDSSL
jgi:tRNA 5-methylaminomethyl-2-thiouridine biosynthesis bifunctional protein